jgi:transcriptional regulator with XRE-family HTH domain
MRGRPPGVELDTQLLTLQRRKRGWSQLDLADAAGLTARTVGRAERGGAVSLATASSLAEALQIDLTSLCPDIG